MFIVCYLYRQCINSLNYIYHQNYVSEEEEAHQNYNINKDKLKITSKAQSKFHLDIKDSLGIKILNPT